MPTEIAQKLTQKIEGFLPWHLKSGLNKKDKDVYSILIRISFNEGLSNIIMSDSKKPGQYTVV